MCETLKRGKNRLVGKVNELYTLRQKVRIILNAGIRSADVIQRSIARMAAERMINRGRGKRDAEETV